MSGHHILFLSGRYGLPFIVVEYVLAGWPLAVEVEDDLRGVVEEHARRVVRQEVPEAVLRGVVDPFLDPNCRPFQLLQLVGRGRGLHKVDTWLLDESVWACSCWREETFTLAGKGWAVCGIELLLLGGLGDDRGRRSDRNWSLIAGVLGVSSIGCASSVCEGKGVSSDKSVRG